MPERLGEGYTTVLDVAAVRAALEDFPQSNVTEKKFINALKKVLATAEWAAAKSRDGQTDSQGEVAPSIHASVILSPIIKALRTQGVEASHYHPLLQLIFPTLGESTQLAELNRLFSLFQSVSDSGYLHLLKHAVVYQWCLAVINANLVDRVCNVLPKAIGTQKLGHIEIASLFLGLLSDEKTLAEWITTLEDASFDVLLFLRYPYKTGHLGDQMGSVIYTLAHTHPSPQTAIPSYHQVMSSAKNKEDQAIAEIVDAVKGMAVQQLRDAARLVTGSRLYHADSEKTHYSDKQCCYTDSAGFIDWLKHWILPGRKPVSSYSKEAVEYIAALDSRHQSFIALYSVMTSYLSSDSASHVSSGALRRTAKLFQTVWLTMMQIIALDGWRHTAVQDSGEDASLFQLVASLSKEKYGYALLLDLVKAMGSDSDQALLPQEREKLKQQTSNLPVAVSRSASGAPQASAQKSFLGALFKTRTRQGRPTVTKFAQQNPAYIEPLLEDHNLGVTCGS